MSSSDQFVLYDGVSDDGEGESALADNIITPSSLLSEASSNGKPFVYVSRARVFGKAGTHHERHRVFPVGSPWVAMAAMENNVLRYDHGYIIRISSSLGAFLSRVESVIAGADIPEMEEHCVSDRVIHSVACGLVSGAFGKGERILHVVGSRPVSRYATACLSTIRSPSSFTRAEILLESKLVSGLVAVNIAAMNNEDIRLAIAERIRGPES